MARAQLSAGTVAYEDTGGEGRPIVFVHGLLMDWTAWQPVIERLRGEFRCVAPTLPLGGHREAMRADADLSMRGVANVLGELMEQLELEDVALAMNDWGGAQLLLDGPYAARVSRLALVACEAFDNVPPKGAARLMPYLARVPGGLAAAFVPFRVHALRRLPITFGHMSKRPIARQTLDRWFAPMLGDAAVRRDLRKYVSGAAQARADLTAASERLARFEGAALVAWAREDKLMPWEHGPRLASLLPQGELVEVADSYTLVPQDRPELLADALRGLMAR